MAQPVESNKDAIATKPSNKRDENIGYLIEKWVSSLLIRHQTHLAHTTNKRGSRRSLFCLGGTAGRPFTPGSRSDDQTLVAFLTMSEVCLEAAAKFACA